MCLVVAGSVDIPGAALLAGLGSLRAGSGILQIATCRSNAAHLGVAIRRRWLWMQRNEAEVGSIRRARNG